MVVGFARRRSQGGYRIWEPVLGQGHHVHVPLDNQQSINVAYCLTCFVQTVEFPTFRKDRCLWGVKVFGAFFIPHLATAKTDDAPPNISNGKHDAVSKPVIHPTAVVFDGQTCLQQRITGRALGQQFLADVLPALRGVTNTKISCGDAG